MVLSSQLQNLRSKGLEWRFGRRKNQPRSSFDYRGATQTDHPPSRSWPLRHASQIDDAALLRQSEKCGIRNFPRWRNPSNDAGREPPHHVGEPEGALIFGDESHQTTPKEEKATN